MVSTPSRNVSMNNVEGMARIFYIPAILYDSYLFLILDPPLY